MTSVFQDLGLVDLDDFRHGGPNITAYRLIDPDNPTVVSIRTEWLILSQRGVNSPLMEYSEIEVRAVRINEMIHMLSDIPYNYEIPLLKKKKSSVLAHSGWTLLFRSVRCLWTWPRFMCLICNVSQAVVYYIYELHVHILHSRQRSFRENKNLHKLSFKIPHRLSVLFHFFPIRISCILVLFFVFVQEKLPLLHSFV